MHIYKVEFVFNKLTTLIHKYNTVWNFFTLKVYNQPLSLKIQKDKNIFLKLTIEEYNFYNHSFGFIIPVILIVANLSFHSAVGGRAPPFRCQGGRAPQFRLCPNQLIPQETSPSCVCVQPLSTISLKNKYRLCVPSFMAFFFLISELPFFGIKNKIFVEFLNLSFQNNF